MPAKSKTSLPDLSNLSAFSLGNTSNSASPSPAVTRPGLKYNQEEGCFEVSMKLIEEDPNQPRLESSFKEESIRLLADTIQAEGLNTPISIREHPKKPDMYMINNGARRFRAFALLGRKTIPATFKKTFTKTQQFIDNIHREDMDNRSVLGFIDGLLKEGLKATEIANLIKKPKKWVTMYTKLLEENNRTIREAFESEVIASPAVAYSLTTLANKSDTAVAMIADVLASATEINNTTVETIKKRLKGNLEQQDQSKPAEQEVEPAEDHPDPVIPYTTQEFREGKTPVEYNDEKLESEQLSGQSGEDDNYATAHDPYEEATTPKPRAAKVFFFAEYKEDVVTILAKEPSSRTKAVIKTQAGEEKEVPINQLSLLYIAPE